MIRHFTATVYIVENEKVLLIFHRKLNKWLPAGGHIDPNETPPVCAKREALEETGLEIELIAQENIWVNRTNAKSFERPFMCLLEDVPARSDQPAHQHIDLIYLGRPIGGKEIQNVDETDGLKWFSLEEIEALESDQEIFEETKEAIRTIFLGNFYDQKCNIYSGDRAECR